MQGSEKVYMDAKENKKEKGKKKKQKERNQGISI